MQPDRHGPSLDRSILDTSNSTEPIIWRGRLLLKQQCHSMAYHVPK